MAGVAAVQGTRGEPNEVGLPIDIDHDVCPAVAAEVPRHFGRGLVGRKRVTPCFDDEMFALDGRVGAKHRRVAFAAHRAVAAFRGSPRVGCSERRRTDKIRWQSARASICPPGSVCQQAVTPADHRYRRVVAQPLRTSLVAEIATFFNAAAASAFDVRFPLNNRGKSTGGLTAESSQEEASTEFFKRNLRLFPTWRGEALCEQPVDRIEEQICRPNGRLKPQAFPEAVSRRKKAVLHKRQPRPPDGVDRLASSSPDTIPPRAQRMPE